MVSVPLCRPLRLGAPAAPWPMWWLLRRDVVAHCAAVAVCRLLAQQPHAPPQPQGKTQFVLFESASGFGLFEVTEAEEIGALLPTVRCV